jgi:hypothetical protein
MVERDALVPAELTGIDEQGGVDEDGQFDDAGSFDGAVGVVGNGRAVDWLPEERDLGFVLPFERA